MSIYALSNVYNNYIPTYAPTSTRYDSHKRGELKDIYNTIVKKSKDTPIFLISRDRSAQNYALSLKENARSLRNAISSLTSEDSSSVLDKKVASSSDEEIVEAKYVGVDEAIDSAPAFDIEVSELASPQTNIGKFLNNDGMDLAPDTYSFDVHINDTDYEFQFVIDSDDTNRNIQDKIARLINRSNIGINASVMEDSDRSALRLESASTGITKPDEMTFVISDNNTSRRSGAVNYFGLDSIAHEPTNAAFSINGNSHESFSNSFTVGKVYELNLKGLTSEGNPVHIGLKPDVEALTDNINHLTGAYNDFIRKAAEYTQEYGRSNKIMTEMRAITSQYGGELDNVGLTVQKDGTIEVNDKLLNVTASDENPKESLYPVQRFTNALMRKTNQISIDPMSYSRQIIAAYKNPGKNYPNPYVTSIYTGMMFSSYC